MVEGEVTIRCAHGDVVTYPLANAKIDVGGKSILVQAAVSDDLPAAALLGWDIPDFLQLVKNGGNSSPEGSFDALPAVTR